MRRSISNITSDPLELFARTTSVDQSNDSGYSLEQIQSVIYKQTSERHEERDILQDVLSAERPINREMVKAESTETMENISKRLPIFYPFDLKNSQIIRMFAPK